MDQWILIAFKKFVIASIDKSIPTVVTLIQSNALALSPVIKIEIGKPIYCVIGSTRMTSKMDLLELLTKKSLIASSK